MAQQSTRPTSAEVNAKRVLKGPMVERRLFYSTPARQDTTEGPRTFLETRGQVFGDK